MPAAALSALVIVLVAGFLVVDGLTSGNDPARLRVETRMGVPTGDTWVIPLAVADDGDAAVENVDVTVSLMEGGKELDAGSVSLPFVPSASSVRAPAVLGQEPAGHRIEARALGYEIP